MPDASKHPTHVLTRRQREIAALVARGYTNGQLADELVLTSGSVANHIQHMLQRLQVDSRAQIAAWAVEHGLTTTQDRLLTTLERMLEIEVTSLPGALEAVAALLAEAVAADRVLVFLHDPAAEALVAAGGSQTQSPQPTGEPDRVPLPEGGPIVATFNTGLACSTALSGQDGEASTLARDLGARSALCVPLHVGDARRGVLVATSSTPDVFSERDLRFLLAVGQWVGSVAQRAELVEQATASAVEAARAAATQDLVTTLADDLRRRTEPLARHVERASGRAGQVGLARDLGAAQEIRRRVRDLRRLVDDLLDVVHLEQGVFELHLEPVDLARLAREATAPFRSTARDVRVRASDKTEVVADWARLRQALEHMLAEATRYLPEGTPLIVEVYAERGPNGAWEVLSVRGGTERGSPPGSSAPPAPVTASGPSSGLGMGLRLASRIAAAHGGVLSVEV
ncbi:MAG: GAF domain-containing protein, partial [Chloroflexi bacterium]|nr:GAF domain-containing protein [Chloroflexota bacterium]